MKNQYFGDVNDYRKYGLLRGLVEERQKLGVCWMLTPSDGTSDGQKIRYLKEPERFRHLDPTLFDRLEGLVGSSRRAREGSSGSRYSRKRIVLAEGLDG